MNGASANEAPGGEGPVFTARGIVKRFPGVVALDGVDLELRHGSIHALLGENGAGKSTLIKAITGVHVADGGTMLVDGERYAPDDTREAMARGVGVVHQERHLVPRFSIAENLFLDRLGGAALARVDRAKLAASARPWLEPLGVGDDPMTPVERLSVAKMQLVEIARALSLGSRILLLDEPTASLTGHETEALFAILDRLRSEGTSLLFVSHKLEEVLRICDAVTVLRDGRNACASRSLAGMERRDIVRLMIGRDEAASGRNPTDCTDRAVALALRDVATPYGHAGVDLDVHEGEILGLYGLVGAGRSELAKAVIGHRPVTAGTLRVHGRKVSIGSVAEAVDAHRIGYVSEDRKGEGLVLAHSVLDNVGMPLWRRLANRAGLLADRSVRERASPAIERLEVRTPSLAQPVGLLSGGNQQKVSVAKWLAAGIEILIVDEPSVGIDVRTKGYLHQLLRELAESGIAIVLITSDLPEMIELADRVVVMGGYRVRGTVANTGRYDEMSASIMGLIQGEAALPQGAATTAA